MRTTLTLDDDALATVRDCAMASSLKSSKAVSVSIRQASTPLLGLMRQGELWVIPAPPDAPWVSAREAHGLIDEWP